MSSTPLDTLIREASRLSDHKAQAAKYEQALALAIELGDEDAEFAIRMTLLTEVYYYVGAIDASLACFTWCLAKLDADPDRFDRDERRSSIMWAFKWMVTAVAWSAAFPRAQVESALADMEAHYRSSGIGPHGVLSQRFGAARALGDMKLAEKLFQELARTPRDSHSDCEACVSGDNIDYLVSVGRDEEALAAYAEMMSGEFWCGSQPEGANATMLLPLLRLGRPDDAKRAYEQSYAAARTREALLSTVAENIVFTAVTGNSSAALSMVERHIGWLDHDVLDTSAHLRAATGFHIVLARLVKAGRGGFNVRIPEVALLASVAPDLGRDVTVSDLSDACLALAKDIAGAMDKRNGNKFFTSELRSTLGLIDADYDLSLATAPFNPIAAVRAEPTDAFGWLVESREMGLANRLPESREAARRAIELGDAFIQADAWATIAFAYQDDGDGPHAVEAIGKRVAAMREAGERGSELIEEAGIALVRHEEADAELLESLYERAAKLKGADRVAFSFATSLATLRGSADPAAAGEWIDRARKHGKKADPYRQAQIQLYEAMAKLSGGDVKGASKALKGGALADAPPVLRGARDEMAAMACAEAGDLVEGARLADAAATTFAGALAEAHAARLSMMAGQIWATMGQMSIARERVKYALSKYEPGSPEAHDAAITLASILAELEEPTEARAVLAPALAARRANPESQEDLAQVIAIAATVAPEDDARPLWAEAVAILDESGDPSGAAMTLVRQFDAMRNFDEYDQDETHALANELVRRAAELDPDDQAKFEALQRAAQCEDLPDADIRAAVAALVEVATSAADDADRLRGFATAAWGILEVDEKDKAREYLGEAASVALAVAKRGEALIGGLLNLAHLANSVADAKTEEDLLRAAIKADEGDDPWSLRTAKIALAELLERAGKTAEAAKLRLEAESN